MHEINQARTPWGNQRLKIALVYPNYYQSMAGLTVQILYHLWTQDPRAHCERFFLPSLGDSKATKSTKASTSTKASASNNITPDHGPGILIPPLRSIENGMPLASFDVVAFSVCYELDYTNICWILDNARIPLRRETRAALRKQSESTATAHPIIIGGGPAIRSNPLPVGLFFDACFIGEIEPINEEFIQAWQSAFEDDQNRDYAGVQRAFIQKMAAIEGFWVPQVHIQSDSLKINRVYLPHLDDFPHPIAQVLPKFDSGEANSMPFGDAFFVEVNRGCPHFCQFCITGSQLKPFRNRSLEALKTIIIEGVTINQTQRVVLIGSSVTEHPNFLELCEFMNERQIGYAIPSIRIDTITPETAKIIARGDSKSVAIAPEAGSDALRKALNKPISNEQIIRGAKILLEGGIANIKLYFLYGIPGETDDDLQAIVTLTQDIAALGYGKGGVRLSLNPFIPKAHTPWEQRVENYMDSKLHRLKAKLDRVYAPLKGNRQVKFETLGIEEAFIQTLFSLGDESTGLLIQQLYFEDYHSYGRPNVERWAKKIYRGEYRELLAFPDYLKQIANASRKSLPWKFIDQKIPAFYHTKFFNP